MKAKVDIDVCIGCALCPDICPEVFKMDGDKAAAFVDIVPKEAEEKCKKAMQDCPVSAISIEQ